MGKNQMQASQREARLQNRQKTKAIIELDRQNMQLQAQRQASARSRNTTRQADVTNQENTPASRTRLNGYDFLNLPLPELSSSLEKRGPTGHHQSSLANASFSMTHEEVDFLDLNMQAHLSECRSRLQEVHLDLPNDLSLKSINNESDVAYSCMVHAVLPVAQIAMEYVDDIRIKAFGEVQLTPYLKTLPGWGYPDAAFCLHLPGSSSDGLPPSNRLYPLVLEFKDKGSLDTMLNRDFWLNKPFGRTRQQIAKYLSHSTTSFAILTDYESWYIFGQSSGRYSCFVVGREDARKAVFWTFLQSFRDSQASLVSSTVNLNLPGSQGIDQWIDQYLKPWIKARDRREQLDISHRRARDSTSARHFVLSDGATARLRELWEDRPHITVIHSELSGSDRPASGLVTDREEQSQQTSEFLPPSDPRQESSRQESSRQSGHEPGAQAIESTRPSSDDTGRNRPQQSEGDGPSIELGRNRSEQSLQSSRLLPSIEFSQQSSRQQSSRQTARESSPRAFEYMQSINPLYSSFNRRPFPKEIAEYLGKGAGISDGLWLPLDQIARLSSWNEFAINQRHTSLVVECQVPNRPTWPHVVLKIAKRGVLDPEVAAYEKLFDLQGDVVPYFLGRYPIDDERHECIMLEKVQETQSLDEICESEVSTLAYLDLYLPRILSLISFGVRHNDLTPQNVIHTNVGPVIVDFEYSSTWAWLAGVPEPFSDRMERAAASRDIETFMSAFYSHFELSELWRQALDKYTSKAFQIFRDAIDQGDLLRPDIDTLLQSVQSEEFSEEPDFDPQSF